ncbi:polysaccharide biosynthesis/export family protein [Granulicella sibirica]|uniref:Polysaccharide export protein n=1 Tax=Granulicella sibirica TaxID=2479048 RepID=A0A4Q0SZE2_9BACT|nr:polysaccharide biosynthesis/export family protein [Granulicella sibirica]RXH54591.1 Polysaccharide export protein [Granulicella sibirica]
MSLVFRSISASLLSLSTLCLAQQSMTKPALVAKPGSRSATDSSEAPTVSLKAPVPAGYLIGPDDVLGITVWKEPSLSGNVPVRPDGMISISLIGDVPAAGLTPMALGADLADRLKKFINDPNVTITVATVNSKHIYLLGEVQHVGSIPLTPGLTPLQAISASGGLTPFANTKHLYILRGEQGKQEKIPFNYKKALKDGDQQGLTLSPGDTIVVP